jgi:hypothetical protein
LPSASVIPARACRSAQLTLVECQVATQSRPSGQASTRTSRRPECRCAGRADRVDPARVPCLVERLRERPALFAAGAEAWNRLVLSGRTFNRRKRDIVIGDDATHRGVEQVAVATYQSRRPCASGSDLRSLSAPVWPIPIGNIQLAPGRCVLAPDRYRVSDAAG